MRSKFFLSGTTHLIMNNINNIKEILEVLDGILADLPTEIIDLEKKDVIQ